MNFFRDKLQQRGYNEKDLAILRNKSETRVEPYERTKTTKKEIPLVFTLPYHPHIKHLALKRALQKHWNLINGNEFLNELFPTKPIIAYKRHKNIKDNIVRSRIPQSGLSKQEENKLDRENVRILMELLDEQNGV